MNIGYIYNYKNYSKDQITNIILNKISKSGEIIKEIYGNDVNTKIVTDINTYKTIPMYDNARGNKFQEIFVYGEFKDDVIRGFIYAMAVPSNFYDSSNWEREDHIHIM